MDLRQYLAVIAAHRPDHGDRAVLRRGVNRPAATAATRSPFSAISTA